MSLQPSMNSLVPLQWTNRKITSDKQIFLWFISYVYSDKGMCKFKPQIYELLGSHIISKQLVVLQYDAPPWIPLCPYNELVEKLQVTVFKFHYIDTWLFARVMSLDLAGTNKYFFQICLLWQDVIHCSFKSHSYKFELRPGLCH